MVPQSNSTISDGNSFTTSSLSRFGMGASNAIVARDGTRASIFIDQNIVNENHEYLSHEKILGWISSRAFKKDYKNTGV